MFTRSYRTLWAVLFTSLLMTQSSYGWIEDYADGQKLAQEEGKDMMLFFTGSDWCVWCNKLVEEVFKHDAFQTYSDEHFVAVELDYPHENNQAEELKAQNKALLAQYGIDAYPTVLLTDAQGLPYAKTGYRPDGADAYVAHLEELRAHRVVRDEKFAAAEKAQGLEKAKLLHEGLQIIGEQLGLAYYDEVVQAIIELDADNVGGLKAHYTERVRMRDLAKEFWGVLAGAQEDPKGTVEKLKALSAREDAPMDMRQAALAHSGQIFLNLVGDKEAAKKAFQASIDLEPDNEFSKMIGEFIEQTFAADE